MYTATKLDIRQLHRRFHLDVDPILKVAFQPCVKTTNDGSENLRLARIVELLIQSFGSCTVEVVQQWEQCESKNTCSCEVVHVRRIGSKASEERHYTTTALGASSNIHVLIVIVKN